MILITDRENATNESDILVVVDHLIFAEHGTYARESDGNFLEDFPSRICLFSRVFCLTIAPGKAYCNLPEGKITRLSVTK